APLLLHARTLFFTDGRYRHQAEAEVPGAEVVLAPGDLVGAVGGVVRTSGDGLGFEPAGLTWGEGQRRRARRSGSLPARWWARSAGWCAPRAPASASSRPGSPGARASGCARACPARP